MTVVVDTGVLYADHDETASRHPTAASALESVYDGVYGQPYVTDYIYDEAVTLTLKRSGSFAPAKRLGERIRGIGDFPDTYELRYVTPAIFEAAVEVFERYDDQSLSFTDATTVAMVEAENVDHVLTFDDDFEGVVDRLDPAEA